MASETTSLDAGFNAKSIYILLVHVHGSSLLTRGHTAYIMSIPEQLYNIIVFLQLTLSYFAMT